MRAADLDEHKRVYQSAAEHAAELVTHIPADSWDHAALGPWTVRTLVGHISRAFATVVDYLARPVDTRDIDSTAEYYLATANVTDSASINARAEQAGLALGADPAAGFQTLRERALEVLSTTAGDPVITTIVGGMRLSDYLPTRTFELAVHSVDLARAVGATEELPTEVGSAALAVAVEIAARRGATQTLLMALTGRQSLPGGFSVL